MAGNNMYMPKSAVPVGQKDTYMPKSATNVSATSSTQQPSREETLGPVGGVLEKLATYYPKIGEMAGGIIGGAVGGRPGAFVGGAGGLSLGRLLQAAPYIASAPIRSAQGKEPLVPPGDTKWIDPSATPEEKRKAVFLDPLLAGGQQALFAGLSPSSVVTSSMGPTEALLSILKSAPARGLQGGVVSAGAKVLENVKEGKSVGEGVKEAATLGAGSNILIPSALETLGVGSKLLRGVSEKPLLEREQQIASMTKQTEEGLSQEAGQVAAKTGRIAPQAEQKAVGLSNIEFAKQNKILAETEKGIDVPQTQKNAETFAKELQTKLEQVLSSNKSPIISKGDLENELRQSLDLQTLLPEERRTVEKFINKLVEQKSGLKDAPLTLSELQDMIKKNVPFTPTKDLHGAPVSISNIEKAQNSIYLAVKDLIEEHAGQDVAAINRQIQQAKEIQRTASKIATNPPEDVQYYKNLISEARGGNEAKANLAREELATKIDKIRNSNLPNDLVSDIVGVVFGGPVGGTIAGLTGALTGPIGLGAGGLGGALGGYKLVRDWASSPQGRQSIVNTLGTIQKAPQVSGPLQQMGVRIPSLF